MVEGQNPRFYTTRGVAIWLKDNIVLRERDVVEQISVIFWQNRSNGDTSMKFGTNVPSGSLCKKKVLATWIFNMAAIFSKMAARV